MIIMVIAFSGMFFLLGYWVGLLQTGKLWEQQCKKDLEEGERLHKEMAEVIDTIRKQNFSKKEKDECGCCDHE
ncbi:hypothetical protein HYV49_05345 [Candidatus Pacearchaeota archaeon]|nr:hypothetical protein [Candidatus Pacearchaeota archaeon]